MSDLDLILSRLLKDRRNLYRLSLRDAAEEIGISFSTLNRIEHFKASPDAETRVKLANWLQVPVETLFSNKEPLTLENSTKPIPDLIAEHILSDKNLNASSKEFLAEFFRQTYYQFVELEKKRDGESLLRDMQDAGGRH